MHSHKKVSRQLCSYFCFCLLLSVNPVIYTAYVAVRTDKTYVCLIYFHAKFLFPYGAMKKSIPTCSYVVYKRSLILTACIAKECIFVYMSLVIICSETISFVFHFSQKFALHVSGGFSLSRSHILIFKSCIYVITSFLFLKCSISFLNCSTRFSFHLISIQK